MVNRFKITRSEKDFIVWSIGTGVGFGLIGVPLNKILIETFNVNNLYYQMGVGLIILIIMAYIFEKS